jgi:GTPase involved in cell partitioning and DNA repair
MTDSNLVIGEVNAQDDTLIVAKGGRGGSPLNDYQREEGQKFSINLDLKLIADVGLVGYIEDYQGSHSIRNSF